jgi:hypothetical protein
MKKNILVSLIVFFILSALWYNSLSNESLHIPTLEKKLYQATSSSYFLFEILLFFSGILILITSLGIITGIASENMEVLFNNNLSKSGAIFISWSLLTLVAFGLSSKLYPNLFFSHPSWNNQLLIYASFIILLLTLISSFITKKNRLLLCTTFFILIIPNIPLPFNDNAPLKDKSVDKPNIIIIGIDSLNVKNINEVNTPFIKTFIDDSLYLSNSYTHIARTFPSWVSILSGQYPINNKARLNLTSFERLSRDKWLPKLLKDNGYTNIYIQDERRFNNIDESFYFDYVIGPPASSAEFLLSHLVNLPFVALSTNLKFFNFFMPHIQNNRAVWVTYDENRFNDYIFHNLEKRQGNLFIASHFTLPHWPYKTKEEIIEFRSIEEKYLNTLTKVDAQVKSYFSFLKTNGYLQNAMVFMISDHGESFSQHDDIPKIETIEKGLNLAGHGTSVISAVQYKVLFALKNYGEIKINCPLNTNTKLSFALSDIAPTITDCLDIETDINFDGDSILETPNDRVIPLESSLQPNFNSKGEVDINGTIIQNSNLYKVNKAGKVIIRDELYHSAISSKQRSIIYDKWQFSFYPEKQFQVYITDLESNEVFKSTDFTELEIKQKLQKLFCDMYYNEVFSANLIHCINKLSKKNI